MVFVGREQEKNDLLHLLELKRHVCACVSGRKKIGKSRFVRECLKEMDKTPLYLTSDDILDLEYLTNELKDRFQKDYLRFSSIDQAFDFIYQESLKREVFLVIDDYEKLKKKYERIDTVLQNLIDKYKSKSTMHLVICTSETSIINPMFLKGFNLQIDLKDLTIEEVSAFYPNYKKRDIELLYEAFGGVPYFHSLVDTSVDCVTNLIELFVRLDSQLEKELKRALKEKCRRLDEVENILSKLAFCDMNFANLCAKTGINSPALADKVEDLLDLHYIKSYSLYGVAYKDEPIKPRDETIYFLFDSSVKFYFKYLYNKEKRAQMSPSTFYDLYIKEDFEKGVN